MSRQNCMMCDVIGNDIFCGYYDAAFMKCSELQRCPDGLDDEDDDEDDLYGDEYFNDIEAKHD